MKYLLSILLICSISLTQELEVDGDLKVTGNIQNDSLTVLIANQQQQINSLLLLISELESRITTMECLNNGMILEGYCDCNGNVLDVCGVCGGDAVPEDECFDIYDYDVNGYNIVLIGNQSWMAENLKATHYRDGTEILTGASDEDWSTYNSPAYGVYDDESANAEIYGNLYNWYAVDDSRGICPENWHVPSDEEFIELEIYLGMSNASANTEGTRSDGNVVSKLAGNADLWNSGILEDDSEFGTSGFNALPAGRRLDGNYILMNESNYLWSSSQKIGTELIYGRGIYTDQTGIGRYDYPKTYFHAVRCIQD